MIDRAGRAKRGARGDLLLTCRQCGETKLADGNFLRNGMAKSGFQATCNACWRSSPFPAVELTCARCGVTKPTAGNFPRDRSYRSRTGYQSACFDCSAATAEEVEQTARTQSLQRQAEDAAARAEAEAARLAATERQAGQRVLFPEAVFRLERPRLPPGQVIYALRDPRDGAVRYVGRTANPQRRLSQHLHPEAKRAARILEQDQRILSEPRSWESKSAAKLRWVAELKGLGLAPELQILERVRWPSRAPERERRWTFHFIHLECELLNSDWPNGDAAAPLREAIRSAAIDYLREKIDSPAWHPLYVAMAELERTSPHQERCETDEAPG